ncbi:transglycosylase domain-containing protein [Bacillus sp. Marseille-P3661]|uniref:transglycosylase domain-containing protein n=1 Tax=Bacillus sp. Marseille-P3661 TaxID=1936234 RepID=UPI000C84E73D|nr:PBP1A family penicillin-binding protein [Bacillus sp. Marseille-P3661]
MSENYRTRQERRTVKTTKKTKSKRKPGNIFKRLIIVVVFLGIITAIVGSITALAFIKDAPALDAAALEDPLSAKVYDRNLNLIADLGTEKRTKITYQDIPKILEDAVLATEDVRFYDHFGIDLKRIGGAVLANVTEGFGAEGASTITQQVVKHAFLSPEKTLKRKIQEQWIAIQLERQFSKEQILTMYLNKIFYGNRAYGVAKAAEIYFGKELSELELHEAALLAGLPQRPSGYDPFKYPEAAEKRRNIVLSLMEKHGKITSEQAEAAKAIPVTDYVIKKEEKSTDPYDAFIDQVIEEIEQVGDIDIFSSGVSIYTTLDPDAQAYVQKLLDSDEFVNYPNERFQAGLVVVETKTGEVLAIGGGRNQDTSYFATDIKRQPGSTIKPIIDYGPAVEHLKWSTYHQIVDEPHSYTNGPAIKNYDNRYKGQMSIRDALADSRNIPALKTLQEVGLSKARDFAANLGISVEETINEAYALGGFNGTSPLELAGAYSAFGNNGVYNKPHTVTKITFDDGREINLKPESTVAMEDYTAFILTDMMKSVVQYGTGRAANVSGVHIAGKTGTTNFDDETRKKYGIPNGAVPDIWFTGYSPEYTVSVWTGYSEHGKDNYLSGNQTAIAKQLFKLTMSEITKGEKQEDFKVPNSIVKSPVEKGSNPPKLPSEFTPDNQIVYEYFVRGTEPVEISSNFNQLSAVQNAEVSYLSDENKIVITWEYDEELLEDVSFTVNQVTNSGPFVHLYTGKNLSTEIVIEPPSVDSLFGFEIIASSDSNPENQSEGVIVDIEIPQMIGDFFPGPGNGNGNEENNNQGNDNNEDNNGNNDDENDDDPNNDDQNEDEQDEEPNKPQAGPKLDINL